MPKVRIAAAAQADLRAILAHSHQAFGKEALRRYQALLLQAIRDLRVDPCRLGSVDWPQESIRTYHLRHSRKRARVFGQAVLEPRHLFVYELVEPDTVNILRVLHDAMDVERHIPGATEDIP
ncbi:type II toxin-antitoxin system RelE/ParE family toxin [Nitrospirillum sp. BR 11164]|uniref:type II toxin-antitoxin system RelE/ParE family toxin n=1 Tax=Nitrospirillum sp. BR 11164 TaxID=3104324 RepID=UPI003A4C68CD